MVKGRKSGKGRHASLAHLCCIEDVQTFKLLILCVRRLSLVAISLNGKLKKLVKYRTEIQMKFCACTVGQFQGVQISVFRLAAKLNP